MMYFPTTTILRHRKENLKKCSLRGLEERADMRFLTYPFKELPSLDSYFALSLEGEELSEKDNDLGIFLIDGTWRHAKTMENQIPGYKNLPKRSLPKNIFTAYPRRQEDCIDPKQGLASIEALFVAYYILKRNRSDLLKNYYWKDEFFKKNPFLAQ